jgi:hypothetical protein
MPSLRQQHRDRRRVLHERPEPRDLVAARLPTAALGQVADAEHEIVAERRADHLDELPPSAPRTRSSSGVPTSFDCTLVSASAAS